MLAASLNFFFILTKYILFSGISGIFFFQEGLFAGIRYCFFSIDIRSIWSGFSNAEACFSVIECMLPYLNGKSNLEMISSRNIKKNKVEEAAYEAYAQLQ